MKKQVAIILCLAFVLSLTACGKSHTAKTNTDTNEPIVSAVTSTASGSDTDDESNETISSDTAIDFSDVSSFEDFVEKMDESGFKTTETKTEDGIIVKLETPTTNTDDKTTTSTPAIPTIDVVVRPTEPTPTKPEKDKTSSEETSAPEKEEVTEPTIPAEPETPSEPEEPSPEEVKKPEYTYTTGQKHEKLHYTGRYLYSTLNAEQKQWYQKIDTAVNNLENEVILNATNLAENRNYYIYYLYMFDNPEHFYLANNIMITNSNGGGLILYYAIGRNSGEYSGHNKDSLTKELKDKIIAKKQTFEKEVNRIISTIPANAPDVWKEKLIYDRILMDSHYNLGAQWDGLAQDNWTAYGIIVNKTGVCESYSEAFQTLCLYAGIKCTGVVGTAGGGHKWNCVELDGEWYMCDITFDDPIGGEDGAAYHYYFNRTSDWFVEYNHDWSDCDFKVPECNGTKYDFDNYFDGSRW